MKHIYYHPKIVASLSMLVEWDARAGVTDDPEDGVGVGSGRDYLRNSYTQ